MSKLSEISLDNALLPCPTLVPGRRITTALNAEAKGYQERKEDQLEDKTENGHI